MKEEEEEDKRGLSSVIIKRRSFINFFFLIIKNLIQNDVDLDIILILISTLKRRHFSWSPG